MRRVVGGKTRRLVLGRTVAACMYVWSSSTRECQIWVFLRMRRHNVVIGPLPLNIPLLREEKGDTQPVRSATHKKDKIKSV